MLLQHVIRANVRYIVRYKTDDGRVIPLYIKSPANCYSNGVSQYNKISAWKMGLDISDDQKWMERYMALWKEIERLDVALESAVKNNAYINPKLITWDGTFRSSFHSADMRFGSSVRANTVLKIRNVYRQGGKYYLQVFVKECKITKDNFPAKSLLDGFKTFPSIENLSIYERS